METKKEETKTNNSIKMVCESNIKKILNFSLSFVFIFGSEGKVKV